MSQDLVATARRTLTRPQHARLLVDGLGPGAAGGPASVDPADGVELIDRHGTPLLLCDPESPLAVAARGGRCATLTLGAPADDRVVFRGQLRPAGRDRVEAREVELVELQLLHVSVRAGAGAPPVAVSLADYHSTHDPELVQYAARVQRHTNDAHEADLRDFVVGLSGTDPDLLAGARLSAVDPQGITVQWVDLDGAHEVRVVFPRRADTCQRLGELLTQALCRHH